MGIVLSAAYATVGLSLSLAAIYLKTEKEEPLNFWYLAGSATCIIIWPALVLAALWLALAGKVNKP